MHQAYDDQKITVRFTFREERADEFLEDGQLVTQMDLDTIDEVMEFVEQFDDALLDVNAIVNGQVINLIDHVEEA